MIWLSFESWRNKLGKIFYFKRIYVHGYIWTPFVRVEWRTTMMELAKQTKNLRALRDLAKLSASDSDYVRGVHNGYECWLAVLEEREPVYLEPSSVPKDLPAEDHRGNCGATSVLCEPSSPAVHESGKDTVLQG